MRKLIFLLIIFLVGFYEDVFALEGVFYKNDYGNLCSENETYPVYIMQYQSRSMFFLNYSENYNLNFNEYYEVPFEESQFPVQIKKLASSRLTYTNDYYNRSVHRIIWEYLYPDMSFNMCSPANRKEKYYYELRDGINAINDGPEFIKEIKYQDVNQTYEYEDPYLSWFYIENADGLEASIQDNVLKVSGQAGEYKLKLKRVNDDTVEGDKLFTDGTNYLLWYPDVPDDDYIMTIIIGLRSDLLKIYDDKGEKALGVCFTIFEKEYCSNENGEIVVETFEDEYEVKLVNNDHYEDLSEKINVFNSNKLNITVKSKIKTSTPGESYDEIIEEENDIVIVHPDSNEKQVIIEVEDTFIVNNIIEKLFLLLGIIYAKFKNF
ncbi:MAG: hypothetical protein E7167_04425 [Firmicutes bacterium]|nr:hypothetical protein [Bacillota bacterium]